MNMLDVPMISKWMQTYSRSIMVGAISLTVIFVGIVLSTQLSLIEQAHSSSRSSYYLSRDITNLRSQWSQAQVENIQKKTIQAERLLLRDFEHLTRWLHQMESHASGMGLRSNYRVRPMRQRMNTLDDVEVVPVDLEVVPEEPTAVKGAYERYMQYLRFVTENQVRVDLEEVRVQGGAGAAQMTVLFHVFVKVPV